MGFRSEKDFQMASFSKFHQLLSLGVLFGASASLASVASAQTDLAPDGSRIERVSYADLNLNSTAGQKTLQVRLQAAADRVCGPAPDWIPMAGHDEYKTCMARAQHDALQTVAANRRGKEGAELAQISPQR